MPPKQIIDVHCHLFNAQYAIKELASASWNHLRGNYPHQKGASFLKTDTKGILTPLEDIKDFAAYIARLLKAALSDCEGNYKTAFENFAKSELGKNASLIVAPLMMDIYFALDDNQDEESLEGKKLLTSPIIERFTIPEDQQADFEAHFKNIENIIREEYEKIPPDTKRLMLSDDKLSVIFDNAKKELLATPAKLLKSIEPYAGIELSPGYEKHMHDLEELANKYPGKVFPFLAVDPRRIGIMKLIEMKVDKGKGIFKGIKLYPPLGYLPTHPNLIPVFDYCVQYDIPITLHCSPGGINNFRKKNYVRSWDEKNHLEDFKTTKGNKSIYYTAPEKWLPVLERWQKLRINFAHFGGGDNFFKDETGWVKEIIQLIKDHPRVYTDISYHTDTNSPAKILEVVGENDCLNQKLMFGTDYIMMMMDMTLGGLEEYFSHFTSFNDRLRNENAKDFLKI
jgi:predicted TIM-barrel fold metal-dependent hydrolase